MTLISKIKGVFTKFEKPEKVLEGNVVIDGSFSGKSGELNNLGPDG